MEFLKEILGEELYSQVSEKITTYNSDEKNKNNQIKIGNLGSGNYIGKEKFDAKETEIAGLKEQLKNANTEIQSYKDMDIESIKKSVSDWETKYNTDTQELQDKLAKKDYEYKVREKVSGLKFTSESAKKSFIADLMEKGLKLENDNILGFDDFVKEFKATDPNAFESDNPAPIFSGATPGIQNKPSGDPNKMDYNAYKEWRKNN